VSQPEATLGTLFGVFLKLGMASFGGGLPGWMHREVVERRRWMSEEAFLAGIALGQVLPGPNSVNLALYIGQQLRGGMGALAAGIGILGPPFLFILLLAAAYAASRDITALSPVLLGVAAAGIGNTAVVGLKTARRMRGIGPWGIALAVFLAVGVFRLPMLPIVLAAVPVSIALAWWRARGAAHGR